MIVFVKRIDRSWLIHMRIVCCSITAITLLPVRAATILPFSIRMNMSAFINYFFLLFSANSTCISFNSLFCFSCLFCYNTIIPYMAWFFAYITTFITFFPMVIIITFPSFIWMCMIRSPTNYFIFCSSTNSTCVGFYSFFCCSCFFCYNTIIPNMISYPTFATAITFEPVRYFIIIRINIWMLMGTLCCRTITTN